MFETAINLTELPWATVLTLASGYCGYFVAHQGNRGHHQTADVTFGTLAFGFWGLLVFQILQSSAYANAGPVLASIGGFSVSVILGAVWSSFGRRAFELILRAAGATLNDDSPSAWASLGRDPGAVVTQLSVKLTNGDIYLSTNLALFKDEPNGPCTFGTNGDIIMFVTHICAAASDKFEKVQLEHVEALGYEATYIPRDQIVRVEIRQYRRPSLFGRLLRRIIG